MCVGGGGSPFLTSVGLFEWADETRVPAEFLHAAGRPRQETHRTGLSVLWFEVKSGSSNVILVFPLFVTHPKLLNMVSIKFKKCSLNGY